LGEPTERKRGLTVSDLWVAYGGNTVVRNISLTVDRGEAVALLGRNGAGKTTTLMAIAGAVMPLRGSVDVDGVAVHGRPTYQVARHGITLVPQGRRIFESLTVRENLTLGMRGGELSLVHRLFPILAERARQLGSTLSGGEQQMLAIGRALLTAPNVLLLDEPSEGLAGPLIRKIGGLMQALRREQDLSILIAEQNVSLALSVADRVYVLERGEVAYEGPADQFREARDLQRRYLGV
jgi:branched-chain amino acid transport system ATP-binding protein